MKCYVVKDLLSNYIDGLCSEDTSEGIKKHLDVCDDCRAIYEKMSTVIPEGILPEHSGSVVDAVRLAYEGINRISKISRGRTINRNGENIRVVYYCYTRTLWDSLFFDDGFAGQRESGRSFGSDIYGENYESAEYEPQMREIYYLPVRNLHKIGELSDEEFDGLREKGSLIWSGVI